MSRDSVRTLLPVPGEPEPEEQDDGVFVPVSNTVSKRVGGVAYQPTFLLDAVLLADMNQPSMLKETVSRPADT